MPLFAQTTGLKTNQSRCERQRLYRQGAYPLPGAEGDSELCEPDCLEHEKPDKRRFTAKKKATRHANDIVIIA